MARCVANFGERRGADMRLLAAEWDAQLCGYPADRLHAALDKHMRQSAFWPTISELLDSLALDEPRRWSSYRDNEPWQFARDGRTEAEEIAYRAGQVARMKARHGFGVRSRCDGQAAL